MDALRARMEPLCLLSSCPDRLLCLMESRAFAQWTLQDLQDTFRLKRHTTLPSLETWLAMPNEIDPAHRQTLERLQERVARNSAYWSEEELKFFLIAPLINMADYHDPVHFFGGRLISAQVDDFYLSGVVDGMLADGEYAPRRPFFCLHEYKPEESGRKDDPAAQVLSAMLVADRLNEDDEPVFGAYVLGRFWFFLVLEGRNYAISKDYSTSHNDIFDVLRILKNLDQLIRERVERATLRRG